MTRIPSSASASSTRSVGSGRTIARLAAAATIGALTLLLAGCGQWSWNPVKWFQRPALAGPLLVEVLSIESQSGSPTGERFEQSWDGARLVIDVHSPSGIGKAILRPRDRGWPLRLTFRMHVSALEGFEARAAQNMRISLGSDPLTEPASIDLPYGVVAKDSEQLEVQWVDHYR